METSCGNEYVEEEKQLELPPGFRFYPYDEELVSHYLARKVLDPSFRCLVIGEADLNKCEPWDLPRRAKMGEKEWYFFSLKDRKYPTGLRINRATDSGYWKATGKDKEIYKMKTLMGMKKTLVFYGGRAPKGEKTNWVMHEFRLDGKYAAQNLPKTAKNEWVISRIFEKCSGGKKIHITNQAGNVQSISKHLPPLMDSSPYTSRQSGTEGDGSHATGFSNPTVTQPQKITKDELVVDIYFNNPVMSLSPLPPPPSSFAETPLLDYTTYGHQFVPSFATPRQQSSLVMQDQGSILRNMLKTRRWNNSYTSNNSQTRTRTQTQNAPLHLPSGGMIQQEADHSSAPTAGNNFSDFDSIWSYFMQ